MKRYLLAALMAASPAMAQSNMAPVPMTGPYGWPSVTRDPGPVVFGQYGLPMALRPTDKENSPDHRESFIIKNLEDLASKQHRYEALLRERYDGYLRQYNRAMKQANDAFAKGRDPGGFIENAREAARNCETINLMWLESQKP